MVQMIAATINAKKRSGQQWDSAAQKRTKQQLPAKGVRSTRQSLKGNHDKFLSFYSILATENGFCNLLGTPHTQLGFKSQSTNAMWIFHFAINRSH